MYIECGPTCKICRSHEVSETEQKAPNAFKVGQEACVWSVCVLCGCVLCVLGALWCVGVRVCVPKAVLCMFVRCSKSCALLAVCAVLFMSVRPPSGIQWRLKSSRGGPKRARRIHQRFLDSYPSRV